MAELEKHLCTLSPGDYVTLVAIPGKIEKTTQLYGFLGLDPEREFLLKNGKPIQGVSPFTAVMIAFLISAIIILIMLAFDVLMFSFPTGGDWKLPVAVAVVGFIAAGLFGVFLNATRQSGQTQAGNKVGEFIGIGFLGAIGAPLLLLLLNARLDTGASQLTPISIDQFWQTTHNLIIRDYEVEYRKLGVVKTEKRHIRVSQIDRLGSSDFGVVEEKPGRFGFPWISGVHPAIWIPAEDAPNVDGPTYRITLNMPAPDDPNTEVAVDYVSKPIIELDYGKYAPLPEVLLDKVIASMQQRSVNVEKIEEPE